MRFQLLACDYDGTIAKDGRVDEQTLAALRRVPESGRTLALVTGRELFDLLRVFPEVAVFDWVVAENGGVLYEPKRHQELPLAPPPSEALAKVLRDRGVTPLSLGRTIIATWEPHETTVLAAIHELGLELQVTFNKGAVMVLPASVNKRSGLEALLAKTGFSAHNCVGIGDAENDHAFLSRCEFSVAVGNALSSLKQSVDWVTAGGHGAGVRELIDLLLETDLAQAAPLPARLQISLGTFADGTALEIPSGGKVGLIAGGSGRGKSSAATSLLEQVAAKDYQICIIDPEGDHEDFPGAVVVGSVDQPPALDQISKILTPPSTHVVINMLAWRAEERTREFLRILLHLQQMRAKTGRPHWIAVDEAHHVLDRSFQPIIDTLPAELASMLFVTARPDQLHPSVLGNIEFALVLGRDETTTLDGVRQYLDIPPLESTSDQNGFDHALFWQRGYSRWQEISLIPSHRAVRRHRRKYASGELGTDKSFYFRGAEGRLNLRVQNLIAFNQIGAGVDDDTWSFHLKRGDYSQWIRDALKDEPLASRVEDVETSQELSAQQSRERIRALIEQEYTAPA